MTYIKGKEDEPLLANPRIERLVMLARTAVATHPRNCEYVHAGALHDLAAFLKECEHIA